MKSATLSSADVARVTTPAVPVGAAAHAVRRLNFFQQAMLLWDEVHPYNAVHAVRLRGSPNVAALRIAIHDACRSAGIGEIEIDRASRTIRYGSRYDAPVEELPATPQPEPALAALLERQLNLPFPAGPHHPTRWSVVRDTAGREHYVVLTYHHVTSDAAGIEMLLAAVLGSYAGAGSRAADALPEVPDESMNRRLHPRIGLWHVFRAWVRLGLTHARLQRVYQMPDDAAADDSTSLLLRSAPAGLFPALSAECHRRGIGVNDAFMAALAQGLSQNTPARKRNRWRRRLAIGTVISGRKWLPPELSRYFGVHLADFVTVLNRPDDGLDAVLDQITAQTRRLKGDWRPAVAGTALRVLFVRHIWPLFFIRNRRSSYRRSFPVCGGVSTVVIESDRFSGATLSGLRYVRAAPPGPAVPIVLAPTVFADRLELCLIYRHATLSACDAGRLMDAVLAALQELVKDCTVRASSAV